MKEEFKNRIDQTVWELLIFNKELNEECISIVEIIDRTIRSKVKSVRSYTGIQRTQGSFVIKHTLKMNDNHCPLTLLVDYDWVRNGKVREDYAKEFSGQTVISEDENMFSSLIHLYLPVKGKRIERVSSFYLLRQLNYISQRIEAWKEYRYLLNDHSPILRTFGIRTQDAMIGSMYASSLETLFEKHSIINNILLDTEACNQIIQCQEYCRQTDVSLQIKALLRRYELKFAHRLMEIKDCLYGVDSVCLSDVCDPSQLPNNYPHRYETYAFKKFPHVILTPNKDLTN